MLGERTSWESCTVCRALGGRMCIETLVVSSHPFLPFPFEFKVDVCSFDLRSFGPEGGRLGTMTADIELALQGIEGVDVEINVRS